MALQWIDVARNNLQIAWRKYAEIQRQLDRYNKVFEAYSNASPETQIRAESVIRYALDVYTGLKKQQEENAMKMYEAQQWVNYYRQNTPQTTQTIQGDLQNTPSQDPIVDRTEAAPVETVPVIATTTPWALNNNAPITNVDTTTLNNTSVMTSNAQVNPTASVWTTNIIKSQTPKYPNTTISPVQTSTPSNINWSNYWPGSVAQMPGTWNVLSFNTTTPYSTWRKTTTSNLWKTVNELFRKWATYLYNYLKK